ncbi:MAG: ribosome small subunit-dependent GTPase A [Candidatus Solibacter sp.]|nr:ribosome small subunit-dependent GTPase A [Candidatus Solibacter sp.]
MNLERLGATPELRASLAPGLTLARVSFSHRDQYRLIADSLELEGEPSGALWYNAATRAAMPVVGDWVAARVIDAGLAIVEAVLPRRTLFARRAAGRREDQQPIAANIDVVFLVCGLDGDFNLRRLERYLTLAAESGAEAVVVLNKSDLCGDVAARIAETAAVAGAAPVVAVHTRGAEGIGPLRRYLTDGRTAALLGSSGVGKSSLVNCLMGEDRLRTAEVREQDSRGRHTTTYRELIALPGGGALIDTPGMRELQLWAGEDAVDRTFDEIARWAAECRYRDCTHAGEQGCAVQGALADGALAPDRWESYRKLRGEAQRHEALANSSLALERKKKWKQIHKAAKEIYKLPKHR